MEKSQRLLDCYLPPEGFVLESIVATTYQVDFEFLEEELLAAALGVRSPTSRMRAFRSELERKLQAAAVSVLYDLSGCERLARHSPRIDAIPIVTRKLHAKITLLAWVRKDNQLGQVTERRVRLLIGSANLTRQGFRENYECVACLDFGGRSHTKRSLLTNTIKLLREIAAETASPQLTRQLASFDALAVTFPEGETVADDPLAIVSADEAVATITQAWSTNSSDPPAIVRIVSPFWPEGTTAADAISKLVRTIGLPDRIELVCRSVLAPDGRTWLPEFDGNLARQIREQLATRLFLHPALPEIGAYADNVAESEPGDEGEEEQFAERRNGASKPANGCQRALHAKMLLLDGKHESIFYIGSSNCTRKGLGLGGPSNWEAGLVYRLTSRHRKQIESLFRFVGPALEVVPGAEPTTVEPEREKEQAVPRFLLDVTALGTEITIRFRPGTQVPDDLRILMPIVSASSRNLYRKLWPHDSAQQGPNSITANLATCLICDASLTPETEHETEAAPMPHVYVEVYWDSHKSSFPVRFDDKASLPVLLYGRKATEGELIDYFLYGQELDDGTGGEGINGNGDGGATDTPIDTRRILAYFMRRFVQAIPGLEAEVMRASYSHAALDSALRGPTSPLELAERANSSLRKPTAPDEPQKTPTAVAFQITEILSALLRCQRQISDADLSSCFVPVIDRLRQMLAVLVVEHVELQSDAFQLYSARFGESQA